MPEATGTFRIFVSSTFTDLKEERNALKERVFPRLRELCAGHGCRFQAIDLRWGVSAEASRDQRTMRICREELERCQRVTPRPNFIVLLGSRYGWRPLPEVIPAAEFEPLLDLVPEGEDRDLLLSWYQRDDNAVPPEYLLRPRRLDVPPGASPQEVEALEAREEEEWRGTEARLASLLRQAAGELDLRPGERIKYTASATEQEIEAGALQVADAHEHVLCFFRAVGGLPCREAEGRYDPAAGEFLDTDGEGNPDPEAARMLEALKERLSAKLPREHVFSYRAAWRGSEKGREGQEEGGRDRPPITTDHLDRLCEDVYLSLAGIISEEIAAMESVDPLERETADHEAFACERSAFFTGRESILSTIAEYVHGASPHPLAVWGEGGTGKSALAAHALSLARKDLPHAEVICRFVGATPSSTDARHLLEGLCRQLAAAYRTEREIPSSYDELAVEFRALLSSATGDRPLIIFLDSLDQLSDAYGAKGLDWFPDYLPEHVRLVATTRPGDELEALRGGIPEENVCQLEPMPLDEGGQLLERWLADAGRTLTGGQREEIMHEFASCGNPLYMRLAFEQARHWSSSAAAVDLKPDVEGIIDDLYERLASEPNHGRALTSRALGYLAASRYGLSEDEMIDLLSRDAEVMSEFRRRSPASPPVDTLPVAVWSRFHLDLSPYLAERASGGAALLAFYHRELWEVAAGKYLSGEDERRQRLLLAGYFDARELGPRKISELPWQLSRAGSWDRLYGLLSDLAFLGAAWAADQFDVKGYWARVEEGSPLRMTEAYRRVIDEPGRHREHLRDLAKLLYDTGHPVQALFLRKYLVGHLRESGDRAGLQAALGGQAVILYARGDLDGAMELHEEEEGICRKLGDMAGLQRSLGNQARILQARGEPDEAMALLKEKERICRELGYRAGLHSSLGGQAMILHRRGDYEEAMALLKEKERICRELGDMAGLQRSLGGQAGVFYEQGNRESGMSLLKEQEGICRELGDMAGLQRSLGNQAAFLVDWYGDLEGAMAILEEQERICRELGHIMGLCICLRNQAETLERMGRRDEALPLVREAYEMAVEHGMNGVAKQHKVVLDRLQ